MRVRARARLGRRVTDRAPLGREARPPRRASLPAPTRRRCAASVFPLFGLRPNGEDGRFPPESFAQAITSGTPSKWTVDLIALAVPRTLGGTASSYASAFACCAWKRTSSSARCRRRSRGCGRRWAGKRRLSGSAAAGDVFATSRSRDPGRLARAGRPCGIPDSESRAVGLR